MQLGEAFPVTREALLARVESVSVADYLEGAGVSSPLVLVSEVETLSDAGAPGLGRLREKVVADRDRGSRIILLSRRPRVAFPNVPGSSVLRDAKLFTPPRPVDPNAPGLCFGSEATVAGVPYEVVVSQALRELGEAACAGLDAALFEDGRDLAELHTLEESLTDALISSGLLMSDRDAFSWAVNDPGHVLRSALSDVIATMRFPQIEFTQVSANCWAIERLVKQAIRARARTLWASNWKCELLDLDLQAVAVKRAAGGVFASVTGVDDLRDPLEWLSLAETLHVRESTAVGSLGVTNAMWRKAENELLPIKDRVERSQLLRKNDSDIAHRWLDLFSKRLSLSGSRSPEEAIELAPATQRSLLEQLRAALQSNPRFVRDIEKDVMSLVTATVRFIAHALDSRPSYTTPFSPDDAPLERELQDAFKAYLDMSDLAGRVAVEVSGVGSGRADVVLYMDDGTRYVTEVKRELQNSTRAALETSYLAQTVAYQAANVPVGQLLVLDLTRRDDPASERLDESIWVAHNRDEEGAVIASTVVAVVRGNRPTPSARS